LPFNKYIKIKMNTNFDHLIKLLMLGDPAVGKTNFLLRFTENTFIENYMNTIGFDYKSETLQVDSKTVKLQIWDTAGQDRYKCVTKNFYQKAQGIVLMYDITSEESFFYIKKLLKSIKEVSADRIAVILIGNKIDLEADRRVSFNEGKALAEENDLLFLETSAKSNVNVKETFTMLTRFVLTKKEFFLESDGINLKKKNDKDRKNGCGC
jgi:small GTP-binding protein